MKVSNAAAVLFVGVAFGQVNFDFESASPSGWTLTSACQWKLDREQPHSGVQSLRLTATAGESQACSATQHFSSGMWTGKRAVLSGWVRLGRLMAGDASIRISAGTGQRELAFRFRPAPAASGWMRLETALPIPKIGSQLTVTLNLNAGTTAWFDDLEVSVAELTNFDFEMSSQEFARDWEPVRPECSLDLSQRVSGSQSLRIRRITPASQPIYCLLRIPADLFLGKLITVRVHIRTENVKGGRATLLVVDERQDGTAWNGATLNDIGPLGSTEWALWELEHFVSSDAQWLRVACGLLGDGTAWFDKMSFEVVEIP